jgi:hypothetical protein
LGGTVPIPLLILSLIFKDEYYAQANLSQTYDHFYPLFDLGEYQERNLEE